MSTFLEMKTRIATDLRRSNLLVEIGNAINDAVSEASKEHFYFNEVESTFNTVLGTELYDNTFDIVAIETAFYLAGTTREPIYLRNDVDQQRERMGNIQNGRPEAISQFGDKFRLYPRPDGVYSMFIIGYSKLSPFPLTLDAHTNAWLSDGELYIRALAKRNLLRDVIRDYGEARVWESVAEDYKTQLIEETSVRNSTGCIRSTQF